MARRCFLVLRFGHRRASRGQRSVGLLDGRLGHVQRFVSGRDFTRHGFGGVGERRTLRLQRGRALVDFRQLAVCALAIDLETAQLIATFARKPICMLHARTNLCHRTTRRILLARPARELLGGLPHLVFQPGTLGDGPLAISVHTLA